MNGTNHRNFEARMGKINRRHQKLQRGYVMSVGHDGLIIAEPRERRMSVPWRGILFILTGFLLVKGMMLAQVGAESYQARVDRLAAGNQVEKVGAYVLHADPITVWIADQVAPWLPRAAATATGADGAESAVIIPAG